MHNPKYIYDISQNTDEWFALKVGRIGASSATDLLMDKKTKGYQALRDRLVEELITKQKTESKVFKGNVFTERGHELEPIAAEDYELRNFQVVDVIGCVILDEIAMCSPDRLISDEGLLQIKCPIFNTQKKYLKIIKDNAGLSQNELLKKIDGGYYKQCNYEIFITGRDYNVFNSFHPNLPPIDLVIVRDEPLINLIKLRLSEIKLEVLDEIEIIKSIV